MFCTHKIIEENKRLKEKIEILSSFVRIVADKGLKADLNPTRNLELSDDENLREAQINVIAVESDFYSSYMQRIEDTLREEAKSVLRRIDDQNNKDPKSSLLLR